MASADIAFVCDLNLQLEFQRRLRLNSDANEVLASCGSRSE